MIYIPYLDLSAAREASEPVVLSTPKPRRGREPLRHILLGSSEGVEEAVKQLHVLKYAEQLQWIRVIEVPETGILITPNQGEVMRYWVQWRVIRDPLSQQPNDL